MSDYGIIILSGGKSSRMQREKAFLLFNDQPLIEALVGKAHQYFQEVIIVTNTPVAYRHLDAVIATDVFPGQGPLAGIHAGLLRTSFNYNLVVACDMPFVNLKLGISMAEQAAGYDAVVPVWDKGPEPLYSVYGKSCLPVIEDCLQQMIRKTTAIYADLKVKKIGKSQLVAWGAEPNTFLNVNTPAEWANVQSMMEEKTDVYE